MSFRLTPAIKGFITALLMIAAALIIDTRKDTASSGIQYIIFIIYGVGIIWALISFSRTGSFTGKFGELFGQGFRCFIVVTLVMVIFTAVFIKMHPEFAEMEAAHQREELIKLNGRTPNEIDELVLKAKKQYAIRYISASIFGYLIIGAGVTVATSIFLTRRNS